MKNRTLSAAANGFGDTVVGGERREAVFGAPIAPPLVTTVTVKVACAPVLRTTEAGGWHVAPEGAPVQVKETVPL